MMLDDAALEVHRRPGSYVDPSGLVILPLVMDVLNPSPACGALGPELRRVEPYPSWPAGRVLLLGTR